MLKVQALAERSAMCSGLFSYSERAVHIDYNITCSNLSLGPQPWTIVPLCYLLEEHKTKNNLCPRMLAVLALGKVAPSGRWDSQGNQTMLIYKVASRIHGAEASLLPENSRAPQQWFVEEKNQPSGWPQQIKLEFEDYIWQVIIVYYASVFNSVKSRKRALFQRLLWSLIS